MSLAVNEDPRLAWLRADLARAEAEAERLMAALVKAHEEIGRLKWDAGWRIGPDGEWRRQR